MAHWVVVFEGARRSPRQLQNYMIEKNKKFHHTAPEETVATLVRPLIKKMGYHMVTNIEHFKTRDPETKKSWDLQLDHAVFLHKVKNKDHLEEDPVMVINVDGKLHQTKRGRQKDLWRDTLLTAKGVRSLHIHWKLTTRAKWRKLLMEELQEWVPALLQGPPGVSHFIEF